MSAADRPLRHLTLVSEPGSACGCDRYILWTESKGPISTCSLPEHFGQPLSAHPSLRGA